MSSQGDVYWFVQCELLTASVIDMLDDTSGEGCECHTSPISLTKHRFSSCLNLCSKIYADHVFFSFMAKCALWYYAQMVGWIKMPLDVELGLDPSDIVLDGDPGPSSPKKGTAPSFLPMSIVAKRLHRSRCQVCEGRPRPRPHWARWGPSSPSPEKGAQPPNFRSMFVVAKLLDGSKLHLVWW